MTFASIFRRLLPALLLLIAATSARAELNAQEQQIASLMANASGQNRPFVTVDPTLSKVARARAMDLAKRRYFAHVNPDGQGPNYLVRQAGYSLPSSYDQSVSANNIESIAAGDPTSSGTWKMWMDSTPHRTHLLAQQSFYTAQTSIGVGYYYDAGSEYQHYWVVISAPPPGPSLAITTPTVNAGVSADQVTVVGTTAGAPAATKVVVRLENAVGTTDFANATGTASWSAVVTGLIAGPNTLRVRSLDANGVTIKEVTRAIRRIVMKPLVVTVDGSGTVTSGFAASSQREVGATYKIIATPAVGWIFDYWSGSAVGNSPVLTFVMSEGFVLTAHFRANPFFALQNSYSSLLSGGSPTQDTTGFLKVTTTASGSFSGKLTLAGKAYAVTGQLDGAGDGQVSIKRGVLAPLALKLHLDLTGGTGLITGSLTDGTVTSEIIARPGTPPKTANLFAGKYTVAFQPNPADTEPKFPQGTSTATAVVSAAGVASLTGTLADGTSFTGGGDVTPDGTLALYVPLFSGTGALAGNLALDLQTRAITGSVFWTRPARPTAKVFPAAFSTTMNVVGSPYVAPIAGHAALHVDTQINNSAVLLSGGNLLAGVQQMATVLPTNRVAFVTPAVARLAFTIVPATGRVAGSFIHPVTGARTIIRGVILQDRNVASGYFLGSAESGHAGLVVLRQ